MIMCTPTGRAADQVVRQQRFSKEHPEVHFVSMSRHDDLRHTAWIPHPDGLACHVRLPPRIMLKDLLDYLEALFEEPD